MNNLIKEHILRLIDSYQAGTPIIIHIPVNNTIISKNIADASQEDLSDYELGYLYGYTQASNNVSFNDVLATLLVDSVLYKKGVYDGFLNEAKEHEPLPDSLNIKRLLKEYAKSGNNFVKILDSYNVLQDASKEREYKLLKNDKDYKLGVKYSADELGEVKELLDKDSSKKIISQDEDGGVLVGDEGDEVVQASDAAGDDYSLNKVNNKHYQVLKNGVYEYDLEQKQSNWQCSCTGFKYRHKCRHIALLEDVLPKRKPLSELEASVPMIKAIIEPLFGPMLDGDNNGKWAIVGSYRRKKSTIKDVDILIETDKQSFIKFLDILKEDPNYVHTMAGPDIIRGKYQGWDFDVTRVEPGEWGSYLLYRTGSGNFNIKMRALAKKKGWRLSEHGLFDENGDLITNSSEEEIFKALDMPYIPPQNRE